MRTILASIVIFFSMAIAAAACPNWQFGGQTYNYTGQQLYAPQQLQGFAQGGYDLGACPITGTSVRGYAGAAPNYTFNLTGMEQYYLVLDVVSQCDATLLVNAADGSWHFDDDSNGNLDPRMELRAPNHINGRVDVWIGSYNNTSCPATLGLETFFSQQAPAPQPVGACPDWNYQGARIDASANQLFSPQSYGLTAVGGADLGNCGAIPSARGYGPQVPQYSLWLNGMAGYELDLRVTASCDTVMVVNSADTTWYFDDDSGGSLNPSLRIPAGIGLDGRLDVWVGTYGGGSCPATLTAQAVQVSAPAPAPQPAPAGGCPSWSFTGQSVTATGDFLYSPQRYGVTAGGTGSVSNCNIPGAFGYFNAAPAYTFYLSGMDQYRLEIEVDSQCDPTLLVNTADGQWFFNDDSDGLNPRLDIRGPNLLNGRVDVWIGTFGGNSCPATLEMETWYN